MITETMLFKIQHELMMYSEGEPLNGDDIQQITEYLQVANADKTKEDIEEDKRMERIRELLIDTLDCNAITNILSNEDLKIYSKVMGWED